MRVFAARACVLFLEAALVLLFLSLGGSAAPAAADKKPDAAEILRRAEDMRNPDLDYAVEIAVRTNSPEGRVPERNATFAMVAHGKKDTLIFRRTPKILAGGVFLITGSEHWMLMPRGTKPLQFNEGQLIYGEAATADVARLDFSRGWVPTLLGEEKFEDDACYKLELKREEGTGVYTRVRYWIAKQDLLPRRLEYYGTEYERLVHMGRYENYEKGSLGLRPMRLVIEGGNPWEEINTIVFSNLRRIKTDPVSFTPEGMVRFRDTAVARQKSLEGDVAIEDVLADLAAPAKPAAPPVDKSVAGDR